MTLEQKVDLLIKDVEKLKHKARYEKKWLTMEEVMEYTGYKPGTLYQLNFKRAITTRKSGGGLQWLRESVDEYLDARTKLSEQDLKDKAA